MKNFLLTTSLALVALAPAAAQTQIGADIDGSNVRDESGFSVSMSDDGQRFATSEPDFDLTSSGDEGRVLTYEFDGTNWNTYGDPIVGTSRFELSGASISLSSDGERIVIGSPDFRPSNDASTTETGRALVYELNGTGTAWDQIGQSIVGDAPGDLSGESVAISSGGDTIAVGAPVDENSTTKSGLVRTYAWNAATMVWDQFGGDLLGEANGDRFGASVSLSADGSRLAVGAPYNDNAPGLSSGQVRIYEIVGATWQLLGTAIQGEDNNDRNGFSVSLSSTGDRVAMGARRNDGGGSNAGHVRVYDYTAGSPGSWSQVGGDIDGVAASDGFGNSVSLSNDGTRLAAGGRENDAGGADAGHTRLFNLQSGTWTQVGTPILGDAAGDKSGNSVSLSGDGTRVGVGAFLHDPGGLTTGGQTRIFGVSAAFPVEFIGFSASRAAAATDLAWATASERDAADFVVEHALANPEAFTAVGTVPAAGDSDTRRDYDFRHATAEAGTHYYRLRQRDIDGTEAFSAVVAVEVSAGTAAIAARAYPNPVRDRLFVELDAGAEATVTLTDAVGRVVAQGPYSEAGLDVSELASGTYTLTVEARGSLSTERVVKR